MFSVLYSLFCSFQLTSSKSTMAYITYVTWPDFVRGREVSFLLYFQVFNWRESIRVTTRHLGMAFCKKFSIRRKVIDLLAFQKVRIKLLWDVNHGPTYYVLTFSAQIEFSLLMMEDAALEQPSRWATGGTTPFVIKKINLCNLFVLLPTFYTVVAFVAG